MTLYFFYNTVDLIVENTRYYKYNQLCEYIRLLYNLRYKQKTF